MNLESQCTGGACNSCSSYSEYTTPQNTYKITQNYSTLNNKGYQA